MNYRLNKYNGGLTAEIELESSKSESNRALLINALSGNICEINNLSKARDTQTMISLLATDPIEWDVKDAGTTMRFLTAYLAINGDNSVITGTPRMKKRPIGPLANCLENIGAEITYLENEGFPPLKISSIKNQISDKIEIPGNISSQYISALLMIAPTLPKGLEIEMTTQIFSKPYIEMTLGLMSQFGIENEWQGQTIKIKPQKYQANQYTIEGDWSGASYWYSMVTLAEKGSEITLSYLKDSSFQGDRVIADIMKNLGVSSYFKDGKVTLRNDLEVNSYFELDFKDCPDLAQTVLVVGAVLGATIKMTGLESLRIKETDRIDAMQNELAKIGADLIEEGSTWTLVPTSTLPESITVETYEDHRMAMAFAPLCHKMEVTILDTDVVNKSYPSFWDHFKNIGVSMAEI